MDWNFIKSHQCSPEREIFSNPYLSTHKPYWTLSILLPSNILDKITIIWDVSKFLKPGPISSTMFRKKLDFSTANHNRYIKL